MKDSLFLAWKYLQFNTGKTLILIFSVSLVLFIPMGLNLLTNQGAKSLTERAEATPLLVGALGSPTDLNLSTLYFKAPKSDQIPYSEVQAIQSENLALPIPLNLQYSVKTQPIVGTGLSYLDLRNLKVAEGRPFATLGECVLGSEAAEILGVRVGESVISSPAGAFDIAGSFPLKMPVVGILAPNGTADDQAVFTDVKTTWVISGIAHGHDAINEDTADSLLLSKGENQAVASAAILSYTEITPENIASFHFHGNSADFPIDAIIAVPKDKKSELMLRGRYEAEGLGVQMLVPSEVMEELLATVLSVRNLIIAAALIIGIATLIILGLVFKLSIRLRAGEIQTMKKMGAASGKIREVLALEILITLSISIGLSLGYTLILNQFGLPLITSFLS